MGAQFLDLLKKVTIFMLAGQIIVQFLRPVAMKNM